MCTERLPLADEGVVFVHRATQLEQVGSGQCEEEGCSKHVQDGTGYCEPGRHTPQAEGAVPGIQRDVLQLNARIHKRCAAGLSSVDMGAQDSPVWLKRMAAPERWWGFLGGKEEILAEDGTTACRRASADLDR
jgi:hypothetical protein